jgi:hypothetical protein
MRFRHITTLALVGCIALFGCKKQEEAPAPPPAPAAPEASTAPATTDVTPAAVPFKVTSIDLGKAVGTDGKVTDAATSFGPKDTVYVSIATEGTEPAAKLKAKWTFGDKDQLIEEKEATIAATGPINTDFHIAKKSGWPAGKYKVEVFADGTSAGTKDFEVKK